MKPSKSLGVVSHDLKSRISLAEELCQLIKVSSPYYALRDLRFEDGCLAADIPLELTSHLEPFGMSIAEVGRHMAILGSLALANANPVKEKHYYLATDAYLERCHQKPGGAGMYYGKINEVEFKKRAGEVEGVIFSPFGEEFFKVRVKYTVLTTSVFERMFGQNKQTTLIDPMQNPYRNESTLHGVDLGAQTSIASLGIVQKKNCAGHFDNYPAMPIARLGGAMTKISGLHYNHLMGKDDEEFCIKKAEIHAKSFIFAGKKIDVKSTIVKNDDFNGICTHTFANTNDCNNAAELKLWFY